MERNVYNHPQNCAVFLLMLNNESYPGLQGFCSMALPDIDCAHLINTIFTLKRRAFSHPRACIYFFSFCQAASSSVFNVSLPRFVIQAASFLKIAGTDLSNEISIAATTLQMRRNNQRHGAKVICRARWAGVNACVMFN